MYRLLALKPLYLRRLPGVSSNLSCDLQVRDGSCFLRKEAEIDYCKLCARNQSNAASANLIEKKIRKRSKSKKNYCDLLVITDNSMKQQKTTVKKLTWDELKLLASTNLNLSELHKLKDHPNRNRFVSEHTYNNLAVIENMDSISATPINLTDTGDSTLIISDIPPSLEEAQLPQELLPEIPLKIDNFAEAIVETSDEVESEYKPKTHIQTTASYEIAVKTLGSYLEVCSNLNNPQRGFNALIFHNTRVQRYKDKYFAKIRSIEVYNALLKGFAICGDVNKLEEVFKLTQNDHIKPNVQTYIAILSCYGRTKSPKIHSKQINFHIKQATSCGITFDKIMNEGIFLKDERDIVLSVMQMYDPNYIPKYDLPVLQYNNHLVNHLNHENQLREPSNNNLKQANGLFSSKNMQERISRQLELEKEGYITIKSIENKDGVTNEVLKYREALNAHFQMWEETAHKAFTRDLKTLTAQRSPLNYESYLRSLPAKDFVKIIIDEARKIAEGSETYSPTVSFLYKDMGNKVYARYKVLRKQQTGVLDKVIKIHSDYCTNYASKHGELGVLPSEPVNHLLNPRQSWQWSEYKLKAHGATLTLDHREWSPPILQSIGKFLYRIVMHDLKVDVNSMRNTRITGAKQHKNFLPAFYTVFRTQGRIVKEEVKPHPILSKLYRASMPETLTFPSSEIPMLCPPVPWTSIDNGGYLVSPCEVVRLPPQATSQKQRLYEAGAQQLYPSLDALNQLAAVPWRVNTKILDVILEVFNKGGSSKLDVPESPNSLPHPPTITPDMDKNIKFKVFRQRLQFRRKKAEMYSLWCDCLYRLSLANHFRDEVFWLPHNMDFRGRVYPVPPHLNHLGSDLARSMLVFAESRPLGAKGLDWLKIHLINLTGLKKRDSIADRLKYANEILDDILDSADNPLNGKMWWTESEEPWQSLACCMEIAEAIRSGDVENYKSHFPIHQDGSCNGLQHYAALGRDSSGAFSVNLCPSETPQDVYSAVVALVEEQRKKDAASGLEIAKLLDGFVKRKVIKQTIMTTVYGVTRFGARLQIARQLKDIDDFPKDSVWAASSYLTSKTFESLRSMFTSTREIQDWFTDCARLISAVSGQYVEWVTPMGLPIVQPYFRFKSLGNSMVYKPFHMDQFEKPNVMKQKNAFPPNFIHSLDSSHMMLTSLHCERAGITFVSVHDCYWTHPSTVEIMNKICREQFVALHSEPILENLSMFLSEKYSYDSDDIKDDGSISDLTKKKLNRVLRQLPKTGDFDINQVLKSVYFFS